MALTDAEKKSVMTIFEIAAALNDGDQILMLSPSGTSIVPKKITAEVMRAYLNAGFSITINEDGFICIGGEPTTIQAGVMQIEVQTEEVVSVNPNVLNKWTSPMTYLQLSFAAGSQNQVNEYMLEFTVDGDEFSLTLPNGVRWVNEPEWADGNTYQVSVLNGLAIAAEWEPEEEES